MYAAILAKHDARSLEEDAAYPGRDRICADHKIVLVPDGRSLDFDEGAITRRWLHPHIEGGWHLSGWLRVEK